MHRGGRYVVVNAPYGGVVYAVPTATTIVYVGETPYYYYGGTYYIVSDKPAEKPDPTEVTVNINVTTGEDGALRTITSTATAENGEVVKLPPVPVDDEQNYEVVQPPVGVTVPYLPDEVEQRTIGGKRYVVYKGTFYRPFASDGETIYMVVEDPT